VFSSSVFLFERCHTYDTYIIDIKYYCLSLFGPGCYYILPHCTLMVSRVFNVVNKNKNKREKDIKKRQEMMGY
jgi:hypothetical protein